jgi:hypothetical protein
MNPASLRQQLSSLSTTSGGHKEQADRYRSLLEQIFVSPQNELLQIFIETSKLNSFYLCIHNASRFLFQLSMIRSA